MQYSFALAAVAASAAAPLVHAFSVTVTNHCSDPAYLWVVADEPGPMQTLDQSNPSFSAPFTSKSGGGGLSYKVQNNTDLWSGGPQTQLEYKWDGSVAWYDLSLINGITFEGQDISLTTSNPNCPSVQCSASALTCNGGAYLHPNDVDTLSCPGGADIELVFCVGAGSGSSPAPQASAAPAPSSSSSQAPPPPPSSTAPPPTHAAQVVPASSTSAAPAPTSSASTGGELLENGGNGKGDPDVVVVPVTSVVMEVLTVTETQGATPTVGPDGSVHEKREGHIHQHQQRSRHFARHLH